MEERRRAIVELVNKMSSVSIAQLKEAFPEVSEMTIRNDIKALDREHKLVRVYGGVRSLERIDELARLGAKRIAMGTVLVRDESFAQAAAAQFGELLVADVAAKAGQVKVNGWREGVGASADEVVGRLSSQGFKHLVFTDIARDGMQTGIDVEAYRHIAQVAGFPVVASGGISSTADIAALAEAGDDIIEGCITGRALYEGAFTLSEALAAAKGGAPC